VQNHLLGDYLRSFLAVLLVQFTRKRFPGGTEGVARLAERSLPIQARLLPAACSGSLSSSRHP
jgi:hypothetical protein